MKKLFILSLFVLAGCTVQNQQPTQPPVTVKIDNSTGHPISIPQEAQSSSTNANIQTTQATGYVIAPTYSVQDDYFGSTYGTVAEVQYVQQPNIAYDTQTITSQYQSQPTQNQIPVTMYTSQNTQLPTGQIATGQVATAQVAGYPQMMQNQNVNPYYPYAQTTQNTAVQNTADTGSVVVLQNPTTRELVRCDFTDYNCIGSYESQGYVQLRAAPHFAGYNDIPSDTDYPPQRYRDNNNIPRW